MNRRFSAFGLTIDSDIPLPELPLANEAQPAAPEVTIRFATGLSDDIAGTKVFAPFLRMGPGKVWLRVPDIALFVIRDGREVLVEPVAGADEASTRLYLLGSVMGALLGQRDVLVLHGNVIRVGDRAMICVGQSGAGKSTLAAGFMQRGYPVIADDLAAIDSEGRALPGIPRIKLWQETAAHLRIGTEGLTRVAADLPKFNLPLSADPARDAVPVGWLYILEPGDVPGVTIEPLNGLARFPYLIEHTYRLVLVEGMKLSGAHMAQCAVLAGKARIARVSRPSKVFMLDELIDSLIKDMAEH